MQKIEITNFQSHKHSKVNLHPNVNVIVGQSSSGKTAIFRAIEWLNTNRPLGTRFISHGEQQARVTIDDIRGTKTNKGKTTYRLLGDEFDAGSNIPVSVTQSLNLSELNIQNQLDEHFLITSSPGEVARTFNKVLNIEKVDEYVSKLTTQINTTNSIIKDKTEQIDSLTNKIKDLNYLDEMEKEVLFVENKTKLWAAIKDDVVKLFEIIKKIRTLEISLLRDAITSEKISKIIKDVVIPIQDLKKQKRLNDSLLQASELLRRKALFTPIASDLKRDLASIDYSILLETKRKTNRLNGDINQFDAILKKIETLEKQKSSVGVDIQSVLTKYEHELEEFKICPICLSPITNVSHIMKEVQKRYEVNFSE